MEEIFTIFVPVELEGPSCWDALDRQLGSSLVRQQDWLENLKSFAPLDGHLTSLSWMACSDLKIEDENLVRVFESLFERSRRRFCHKDTKL